MRSIRFNRYHVPAVVLLLAGLGLLGFGGSLVHDVAVQERTYSLERYDGSTNETALPDVHDFSDLSEDGRTVVREALESDDGRVTVSREANFPEEFTPPNEVEPGTHYVRYEGEYYRLDVSTEGPTGVGAGFVLVFGGGLVVAGLSLIGFGALGLALPRPLFPTAVLAGLAYPGGKYLLYRLDVLSSGPTPVDVLVVSELIAAFAYGILVWKHPPEERD